MRALAGTSLALLCAAPAARASAAAEALVREAARLEAADACEAADQRYRDAAGRLAEIADPGRRAQLEAVIAAKRARLDPCWEACQPTPTQRSLLDTARAAAPGEPRRASRILRQLLLGRSVDRCAFWAEARELLRALPGESAALAAEVVDPCALSPDLARTLERTRAEVRSERAAAAAPPAELPRLDELARAMDETRLLLADLHEGLLDCDPLAKELSTASAALLGAQRELQARAAQRVQESLRGLSARLREARARLAEEEARRAQTAGEETRLRARFEALGTLTDQLYGDLVALAQTEGMRFSVQVEGRTLERPLDDVQAIVADEKRSLGALAQRYPEAFRSGVDVASLQQKRASLDRLRQALGRFSTEPQRLGQARALAEVDATVRMLDAAIARAAPPDRTTKTGVLALVSGRAGWLFGSAGACGAVALVAGLLRRRRTTGRATGR